MNSEQITTTTSVEWRVVILLNWACALAYEHIESIVVNKTLISQNSKLQQYFNKCYVRLCLSVAMMSQNVSAIGCLQTRKMWKATSMSIIIYTNKPRCTLIVIQHQSTSRVSAGLSICGSHDFSCCPFSIEFCFDCLMIHLTFTARGIRLAR